MNLEAQEYWSYRKEYGQVLLIDECKEKIYSILHSYKRELFINFISHIAVRFGINNDGEMVRNIQFELIGIDINKPLIHRSALNVLYQILIEYRDFSESDNRKTINARDIYDLFLLLNEFWDIEYDDLMNYKNYNETQRLVFFGIKLFYGIVSPEDVQAKSFYFRKIYDEIYNSGNFKNEIGIFEKSFNMSFNDYRRILTCLSERENGKEIYNLLNEKFSLDINEVERKWDERDPKLPIPYEFKFMIDYPILFSGNKKYVLNSYYLFLSLIMRCYYILCNKNVTPNFRGTINKDIFENIIKDFLSEIFIDKNIKKINLNYSKNKEYADWGMVWKNFIFLFEIKAGTISIQKKYGKDIEKFYKELSKKYIEEQGIIQQIKSFEEIDKNYDDFCKRCKIKTRRFLFFKKTYTIFPILLLYDDIFEIPAVNDYMRNKYLELIIKRKFNPEKFILNENDAIITFTDLFVFSNRKFNKPEEKITKLIKYFRSRLPFRMFLEEEETSQ